MRPVDLDLDLRPMDLDLTISESEDLDLEDLESRLWNLTTSLNVVATVLVPEYIRVSCNLTEEQLS